MKSELTEVKPSVKFATKDHKPDDPEETKRIEGSGGFVSLPPQTYIPRVNGQLALSRAFGDFQLKMSKTVQQVSFAVLQLPKNEGQRRHNLCEPFIRHQLYTNCISNYS